MGSARVMAIRQIYLDSEAKRKAALVERRSKTAEVTRVWNEEFNTLKDGHADADRNLKEAFESASQMTYERESEMEELLDE